MNSDSALEEIKNRLDIVDVISQYVNLKKNGNRYKGLCPFHGEKTPSFIVSPDRQMFHCFGCQSGGDMITFIMKKEGLSFPEALDMLARKAGVEIRRAQHGEPGLNEQLHEMQKEAMAFYAECLTKSGEAMAYFKARAITDETIAAFSLGYAPEGWHELLDRLRRRKFKEPHITQSGLVAVGARGPYDMFRQRVMFPIIGTRGMPIAFGGRVLDGGEPKYLNSPETPIFKKGETLYALNMARDEIRRTETAIVVEGYMDAIACHQGGIKNIVAPLGTALTAGHTDKLRRLADTLVLLFDGDRAGISAARRSLGLALEGGFKVRVLMLPGGDDPDGIIKSHGSDHLKGLIENASTSVGFLVDTSASKGAEAAREALQTLTKVTDSLMLDELIHELSERTGTREQSIRDELRKSRRTMAAHHEQARKPSPPAIKQRSFMDEESLLLAASLYSVEVMTHVLAECEVAEFKDPLVREAMGILASDSGGKEPMAVIAAASSEELRGYISGLVVNSHLDDSEDIARIVDDCLRRMKGRRTEAEIRLIEQGIKNAVAAGDDAALDSLMRRNRQLIAQKVTHEGI